MFKTFLNAEANWKIHRQPSYAEGQACIYCYEVPLLKMILYSINMKPDFQSALSEALFKFWTRTTQRWQEEKDKIMNKINISNQVVLSTPPETKQKH